MTKRGGFKRNVRTQARESGKRYTEALRHASGDTTSSRMDPGPGEGMLAPHLEKTYGIEVSGVVSLGQDWPGVFRIDRTDGASWLARVHPPTRKMKRVEGDAAVLRYLESRDYPAERLAHAEPVSELDGRGVVVTEFLHGRPPHIHDVATQRSFGDMLGRLHRLPAGRGPHTRVGGSFHHDPRHEGRPREDLATAMSFLDDADARVPKEHRARYERLREEVASGDRLDGLPEALTHPDLLGSSVIDTPDRGFVAIDWSGAGRGARLAAFAYTLWGAAYAPGGETAKIDAIVDGYQRHVKLEPEELERLEAAMLVRVLYFTAWTYWRSIDAGHVPQGFEGWWPENGVWWNARVTDQVRLSSYDLAKAITGKARDAFGRASSRAVTAAEAGRSNVLREADKFGKDNVAGRTDAELDALARSVGGYPELLKPIFDGMRVSIRRERDCAVGFDLPSAGTWQLVVRRGRASAGPGLEGTNAVLRMSPANFLRFAFGDLPRDTAVADGRVAVSGDAAEVASLLHLLAREPAPAPAAVASSAPEQRGEGMAEKIAIAHVWTSGLSTPDAAHKAGVAGVVADDIERNDARGTVRGKEQIVAEFGTSTLADAFASGTWSEPTVSGDVVTTKCTFPPGSAVPGVVVQVTVNDDGKITRVQTDLVEQPPVDTDPDADALRSLVARIAPGASVVDVRRISDNGRARADDVQLERGGRRWTVELKRRLDGAGVEAFRTQFERLQVLHEMQLPVPGPLLFDEGELFGGAALVTERLPGSADVAEWPKDPFHWAERTGEVLARIHAADASKIPGLTPGGAPADGSDPAHDGPGLALLQHPLGQRLWDATKASPPKPTTSGLIHGDFHSGNVLWSRGRITGILGWAWPFVGSVEIDLAEARIGALLLFGPEVAERMRTAYESARGYPVAEMEKWDRMASITYGLGVRLEMWHYHDLGPPGLTLETMRQRLDDWIVALVDGKVMG